MSCARCFSVQREKAGPARCNARGKQSPLHVVQAQNTLLAIAWLDVLPLLCFCSRLFVFTAHIHAGCFSTFWFVPERYKASFRLFQWARLAGASAARCLGSRLFFAERGEERERLHVLGGGHADG